MDTINIAMMLICNACRFNLHAIQFVTPLTKSTTRRKIFE